MDIGKISQGILFFFLGIIEVLLGFRFVLQLLAANSTATFTDWIYNSSNPLVAPFEGVFPSFEVLSFKLELPAVLAMIVYGIIGAIILVLLRNFEGMKVKPSLPKGGGNTTTVQVPQAPQTIIQQTPQPPQVFAQPAMQQPMVQQAQPMMNPPQQQMPQMQSPQMPTLGQQQGQSFNDTLGQPQPMPQQTNPQS